MIRITAQVCMALAMGLAAPVAFAQTATPVEPAMPAARAAKTLSIDSTVKALLDDARTRAILTAHVPLIVENAPNYPDIYPMTFRALAAMTEAQTMAGLSADVLKKIETEIGAMTAAD